METRKKQPLFIITGASSVDKTTMTRILFNREKDYIVMESDILWNDFYNTPEDDYSNFRELWLRLCKEISQIGKPVVLCGCGVPKQFEMCKGRNGFSSIYYLAVVSDDYKLEERSRVGRGFKDNNLIKSSIDFNNWLKKNADKTSPNITLLDNTNLTPEEAADITDSWILDCMRKDKNNV